MVLMLATASQQTGRCCEAESTKDTKWRGLILSKSNDNIHRLNFCMYAVMKMWAGLVCKKLLFEASFQYNCTRIQRDKNVEPHFTYLVKHSKNQKYRDEENVV